MRLTQLQIFDYIRNLTAVQFPANAIIFHQRTYNMQPAFTSCSRMKKFHVCSFTQNTNSNKIESVKKLRQLLSKGY